MMHSQMWLRHSNGNNKCIVSQKQLNRKRSHLRFLQKLKAKTAISTHIHILNPITHLYLMVVQHFKVSKIEVYRKCLKSKFLVYILLVLELGPCWIYCHSYMWVTVVGCNYELAQSHNSLSIWVIIMSTEPTKSFIITANTFTKAFRHILDSSFTYKRPLFMACLLHVLWISYAENTLSGLTRELTAGGCWWIVTVFNQMTPNGHWNLMQFLLTVMLVNSLNVYTLCFVLFTYRELCLSYTITVCQGRENV